MRIGVLALQGAFAEHIAMLRQLEVAAMPVRLPQELENLDGLIIPGGESMSIGKLMLDYQLRDEISTLAKNDLPVWGTCAGMILLAGRNQHASPQPLEIMDITVRRNAFGRQRESFVTNLSIPVLGEKPFPGVFIRAPIIESANSNVEILAQLDNAGVAARQGKLLVSAFHPELTDDFRFHQYFVDIVAGRR